MEKIMNREVTERDLRMPEFRDAKLEDLEFREDGKIVRKDRWEIGIRRIVGILWNGRREFEIDEIVEAVRNLVKRKGVRWPNGCDETGPKALRYLAYNPRPSGGEERFNAEHLLQIADELEEAAKRCADLPSVEEDET
jgi:hypothetical protein